LSGTAIPEGVLNTYLSGRNRDSAAAMMGINSSTQGTLPEDAKRINAFKYADMAEITNRPQFLSCELQDEIVERLLQEKFRFFSAEWNVFMADLVEKLCALRSVVYCHYEETSQTGLLKETACIQVIMQLFITYMFQRVAKFEQLFL
jgi:hypothetical protein